MYIYIYIPPYISKHFLQRYLSASEATAGSCSRFSVKGCRMFRNIEVAIEALSKSLSTMAIIYNDDNLQWQ